VKVAGHAVRLPGRSVRVRLTAVYVALFLLSGAILLTITYLLVQDNTKAPIPGPVHRTLISSQATGSASRLHPGLLPPGAVIGAGGGRFCANAGPSTASAKALYNCAVFFQAQVAVQHNDDLNMLLIGSGIALAVMTLVALAVGWAMSGRVLGPLRTITRAARNISASNLHQRLALDGPQDELKELGDTIDGLLSRLEASFDAQRQFVANASHELRTPLARQRTLLEVALAEPQQSVAALRVTCERVLVAGEQQERLIEALLTLARSQRGLDQWELVDLAAVTAEVTLARQPEGRSHGLGVTFSIGVGAPAAGAGASASGASASGAQASGASASGARASGARASGARASGASASGASASGASASAIVLGDARLVERLAANLVDNAIKHNVDGGWVRVHVDGAEGRAELTVTNSGPVIPPGEVGRLFAPFQRLGPSRAGDSPGLGLSIVSAIATAHGADLQATARPDGGLEVRLVFPPALGLPSGSDNSPAAGIPAGGSREAEPYRVAVRTAVVS
jgi:signal transduction histidine kinase